MSAAHGHRGAGARRRQRPAGALCTWCRARPALPNARYPHLATGWCCERHRMAEMRARKNERRLAAAATVRRLMGLPDDGRGPDFTAPELEALARRLQRVLPYDGLAVYPAGRRPGRGIRAQGAA